MSVFTIALNTFREAVRDKILYVLTVFAILLILVSRAIGWVSYGGESKIMTDIGLVAIWLFGALVSIFVGTGMIYKEIDKRTLYTILSKPIDRWQFIVGKYLGLAVTTAVNIGILSAIFLAYMYFTGAPITGAIFQCLLFTLIEMLVVMAIAIFFSSASTPILSAIFTSMLFGIGQLTKWIVDLGNFVQDTAPWVRQAMHLAYLFMPNLHNFNIRQQAVHAAGRGEGWAIPPAEMWSVVAYGTSYTFALLLLAILIFKRRNF